MAARITEECVEAARGPWVARLGPRASSRVTFFDDFVVERLIFRGHPAAPFVLLTPVLGFLLERWSLRPTLALPSAALVFFAGVLLWTLLEYLMHRFLFHWPRRGDVSRVVTFVVHGHHHVSPKERSRLAATPVQHGSMIALVYGLAHLAVGAPLAALLTAGTIAGYLAYEAIHHVAHHGRPRSPLMRALVRHHLAHHHETPDRRWGISSPLWDYVFRTHR